MVGRFRKLFLVFCVSLFIFCFCGCSYERKSETSSFFHIDYFYEKEENVLIDNTVIIGIGNSIFNEENVKILLIDDDYYQGITNISVMVFIDDNVEPQDIIEIESAEFFSNKYVVDTKNKKSKRNIEDYQKTFVFDLCDYEINSAIRFVVSYNWMYQEDSTNYSNELILYGNFTNNKFIINRENTRVIWK